MQLKKVIINFSWVAVFILPSAIYCQISVSGSVLDSITQPINYARIVISDNDSQSIITYTFSDEQGRYNIEVPYLKNLKIEFSATYYHSKSINIDTTTDVRNYTYDVILQHKPEVLKEVNLDIKNSNIIVKKNDTIIVDLDAFKLGDEQVVEDLIRNVPGVEVDGKGIVTFQKKPIEKLMVEGDDLFGKGYTILSKNMPSYPLKELEIYKNYSENRLLKGIEQSDKVAMNLILDEEYKNVWFGNIYSSTDFGVNNRYSFGGVMSVFAKKNKHFFLGNLNNLGNNAVGSVDGLIDDPDNTIFPIVQLDIRDVQIGRDNIELNNQETISLSSIYNLSEKIKVSPIVYTQWDEVDFYQNTTTNYNLPKSNISFINAENYFHRKKINIGFGQLKLEYDINENQRFTAISKYSQNQNHTNTDLVFNEDQRKENLKNDDLQFQIEVDYTNKINKQKVVDINSSFIFHQLPQQYSINGFYFSDLFKTENTNYHTSQISNSEMIYGSWNVDYMNRKSNGHLIEFSLGLDYRHDDLNSNIVLSSVNKKANDLSLDDNNIKYSLLDLYITSKYEYVIDKKLSLIGLIGLYNSINQQNSIGQLNKSQNSTYLETGFNFKWNINHDNQLDFVYLYYLSNPEVLDVFENYYITSYNSLSKGSGTLNKLRSSYLTFTHKLEEWGSNLVSVNTLRYIRNHDYFSTKSSIFKDYNSFETILLSNQDILNISTNTDYYLTKLRLNLKLKLGYEFTGYQRSLFNDDLQKVNIVSFIYGFEIHRVFSQLHNLHFGTQWVDTTYKTDTNYAQSINKSFIDFGFVPNKKFIVNLKSDFIFIENQKTLNYLFNLNTKLFLKGDKKTSLNLSIRNLFNLKDFKNFIVNDLGSTIISSRMLPRTILLGFNHRI